MGRGRVVAIALVAGCLTAPETTVAQAPTADDLFNDQTLHVIHLSINSKDVAQLRARFFENTYFPADLTWGELRVRNVAVRSRGVGARSATKLNLRLDFDRYTTGQRFLGLRGLVLDNAWQDKALIRESLAMAVFRLAGQPAPRESFCKLYINNVYQGLYGIVEAVDNLFVTRTLGETGGYLYEYHSLRPYFMTYLGDDLAAYKPLFEPRTHELEDDNTLYAPIAELIREINGPDDAGWAERVGARIDLEQFMTHVAIQGFLGEADGILGGAGINNFYLYRPVNSPRHRLLAWDEDQAFTFLETSILRDSDDGDVVLFQRAYARPALKTVFLDAAERCARLVAENNWLLNEIERRVPLIRDAALEDTRKQFTNDEFLADLAALRNFAARQTQFVLNEIATLR